MRGTGTWEIWPFWSIFQGLLPALPTHYAEGLGAARLVAGLHRPVH